jgi:uncharacterized protein YbaP (TraB family)
MPFSTRWHRVTMLPIHPDPESLMPRRPALLSRCLMFWLAALLLVAQAEAANDRGLIFSARRGDAQIVLLGSIHLGNAAVYPLRKEILDAYRQADVLVVELDIDRVAPERMATWMTAHGMYPAGETLRDHIQPRTWERLGAYLQQAGLAPELFQQYRPGILVNLLTMSQLTQGGLSTELGIDQFFLNAARNDGKPIVELEAAEDQLAILVSMPNADAMINATLDELDHLDEASNALFDAWKRGDGTALEKEVNKVFDPNDPATTEFFEQIFTQRNRAMTARIDAMSREGKQLFVVIGAGHLLGKHGVAALLEQRGYLTEQQ